MGREDHFSFASVRDPWDGMLSPHYEKGGCLLRESKAKGITLGGLSFEDFVLAAAEFEHGHPRPQREYLPDADDEF